MTRAALRAATNAGSYKWWLVAMLWGIAFFNYADRQAVFSLFPLLGKELHLSQLQLGLLGSSFAWTYGLCSPFAGLIVDRIRRKTAILGGLYAWSLICMATALSRTLGALVFFRAAEGLGETFYFPASVSMLSDYHGPRTRSRALGIHQTSVYAGTIGGGFFAALIAQEHGWRSSFVVFGGLGMLLGLLLTRFLIEPRRGAADGGTEPAMSNVEAGAVRITEARPHRMSLLEFLRILRQTPSAMLLMAAFVCANFVAIVLLSWMPQFLFDKFHVGLAVAGLAATIFVQLASMAGAPIGGWLADTARARFPGGRMLVQAIGVFGGAPFVLLCGMTTSATWMVVALIAWGLFKGLYDANIFASIFDVVRPEARGTAAGFMNMVGWLGGGSAPVVIGYVADHRSLSLAISMTAAMYVLAGALLVMGMMKLDDRELSRG
jgi:sugar phosphate permease